MLKCVDPTCIRCSYVTDPSLQLFTSLVPFALGVFNQDISAKVRLQRPSLYRPSQENKGFNSKVGRR